LLNASLGFSSAIREFRTPMSSSRDLAALLRSRPELRNAVVIGEPDYMLDSLPYYAPNQLYRVRISRFDSVVFWDPGQKMSLSLGDLLADAERVRAESGSPVIILLSHELNAPSGAVHYIYGYSFDWNATELAQWRRATVPLASLRRSTTENYDVYLLR
jgi:hypothetical protein